MKILKCCLCEGELEILGEESYRKITKCLSCGYQPEKVAKKEPEVVIIRKGSKCDT